MFNGSYIRHEMNRIQRKNLDIGLYRGNEISLSSYDDIYIYIYMMDIYIYMVDIYIYDGYSWVSHFHKSNC